MFSNETFTNSSLYRAVYPLFEMMSSSVNLYISPLLVKASKSSPERKNFTASMGNVQYHHAEDLTSKKTIFVSTPVDMQYILYQRPLNVNRRFSFARNSSYFWNIAALIVAMFFAVSVTSLVPTNIITPSSHIIVGTSSIARRAKLPRLRPCISNCETTGFKWVNWPVPVPRIQYIPFSVDIIAAVGLIARISRTLSSVDDICSHE